jgi:hypothetical protein
VHAGDGFGIDSTVVTVGKPTAYAGGEARTPATIGTSARIATRVAHLLDFISAPPLDETPQPREDPEI